MNKIFKIALFLVGLCSFGDPVFAQSVNNGTGGGGITFDGTVSIGDIVERSGTTTLGKASATGVGFQYQSPQAHHVGALPFAGTGYLTNSEISTLPYKVYTAQGNERVVRLVVVSDANGMSHTDNYTLYKNGVTTGTTVSIANGTSGSSGAISVDLVDGDYLWISAVTDATTTGGNVTATLKIIQR